MSLDDRTDRTDRTDSQQGWHAVDETTQVRVWDLPTRLFHWALAVCVTGAVLTAWEGGLAMDWHARFGYAVLTLLLFRLVWGFVGGHWSRFVRFVYGPGTLWRYLRGRHQEDERLDVGHSPLGALSVFAVLGILLVQVGTGLFATDDIFFSGPLSHWLSAGWVADLSRYHKNIGQWLVIGLVGLHVLAILCYPFVRGKQLIPSMVDGDKPAPAGTPSSRDDARHAVLALAVLLACAAGVWALVTLGAPSF